ncbi:MAG: hypothetical protein JXA57_05100 [Armatimonadetes bacterium]|nr:hypothetical protein [Armatimonadota bacterium]
MTKDLSGQALRDAARRRAKYRCALCSRDLQGLEWFLHGRWPGGKKQTPEKQEAVCPDCVSKALGRDMQTRAKRDQ